MRDFDPRRALVRSRHGATLPAAAAIIDAAIIIVGKRWAALPSLSGDTVQLQIWMILSCGLATIPAALADSELADSEQTATETVRRHESILLLVGVGMTGAILGGTVWLRIGGDAALISMRISMAWFGMALLSSRALSANRFWILPGTALVLVVATNQSPTPPWAKVITGVPEHWPSWLYALVALVIGVSARYLTPWRLHTLRRTITTTASGGTGDHKPKPPTAQLLQPSGRRERRRREHSTVEPPRNSA